MGRIIKLTESQLRDVVAKVINEQKASPNASQAAKQIWDNLARAVNNMGTDKQGIVSAISMIKSVELYTEVVNMMRGTSSIDTYKSIVQLLNGRFGVYDYKYFKQIQSILTKIGVKITAQTSGPAQNPFLKVGSIRQEVGPTTKPSTTPDANKPTYRICKAGAFPLMYGCKQTEVGKLQKCLGMGVDYSLGPDTLKKFTNNSQKLIDDMIKNGISQQVYNDYMKKCVYKIKQKTSVPAVNPIATNTPDNSAALTSDYMKRNPINMNLGPVPQMPTKPVAEA
jgi:polyhydroxyalkanoate synthesis regulator phasin